MNIVEIWQKNNGTKTQKPGSDPVQPRSPRSEFQEIRRDLPPEVQQDISNFRAKFPQLKEHVIYRIMKKHDLKHNLVESELRFIADMQGTQPVEPKEKKAKKPRPPKELKESKEPREARGGEGEPRDPQKLVEDKKRDAPNSQRQGSRKDLDGDNERTPRNPKPSARAGGRDDHFYRGDTERQERTPRDREWKGRYRNDRSGEQGGSRQTNQDSQELPLRSSQAPRHPHQPNNHTRKNQSGNQGDRPYTDRSHNSKSGQDRQNFDRPNNREAHDRSGNKRSKGHRDNQKDFGEYVAKTVDDQRPRPPKPQPEPEPEQEKGLSKINEESEDMSQHRVYVDESVEVKQLESAKKSLHHGSASKKSTHHQDRESRSHDRSEQSPEQQESHPSPHQHPSHMMDGHLHHTPSPPHVQQNWEQGLLSNGLAVLSKFFFRSNVQHFRQFIHSTRTLESKTKSENRLTSDKRPAFAESKKRKPAIKNNFETDENDESNNERAKKMNHLVSHKRFESEEERMKGDRERAMESKINDSLSQFNFLAQKIKSLEAEVASLRAANQELAERHRDQNQNGEDNIFCFVPYHFVKDWYPFNSIRVSDLKAGNVYMVKKDD